MNPKWLSVAAALLHRAARRFPNYGCVNWQWPADWTPEERLAFTDTALRAYVQKPVGVLTADEEEDVQRFARGEFGPPDWWVMAFLADYLADADGGKDADSYKLNPGGQRA